MNTSLHEPIISKFSILNSCHCICFATASLPISKDTSIISLKYIPNYFNSNLVVNLLLRCVWGEYSIEPKHSLPALKSSVLKKSKTRFFLCFRGPHTDKHFDWSLRATRRPSSLLALRHSNFNFNYTIWIATFFIFDKMQESISYLERIHIYNLV